MKPTIVEMPRTLLVGMGFFGDPFRSKAGWTEENEIGRTWQRFMAFLEGQPEAIPHAIDAGVACELHVYHPETPQTGEFEVFVGLEVSRLAEVPLVLTVKVLPPATYAVFTLQGEEIASDWSMQIFAEWLPPTGYEGQHSHSIQRYDERFKGLDRLADSVLEVYIPVRRREPGES
jgi:predicted transcriptional regulator YdeE